MEVEKRFVMDVIEFVQEAWTASIELILQSECPVWFCLDYGELNRVKVGNFIAYWDKVNWGIPLEMKRCFRFWTSILGNGKAEIAEDEWKIQLLHNTMGIQVC